MIQNPHHFLLLALSTDLCQDSVRKVFHCLYCTYLIWSYKVKDLKYCLRQTIVYTLIVSHSYSKINNMEMITDKKKTQSVLSLVQAMWSEKGNFKVASKLIRSLFSTQTQDSMVTVFYINFKSPKALNKTRW